MGTINEREEKKRKERRRRTILLLLALLGTLTVATATVFVYFPMNVSVNQQSPPITFELDTNAGQQDVGAGNTIEVSLGANKTSATLTLHPTYQKTLYTDILQISNGDTIPYNVYIRVSNIAPSGLNSHSICKWSSNRLNNCSDSITRSPKRRFQLVRRYRV